NGHSVDADHADATARVLRALTAEVERQTKDAEAARAEADRAWASARGQLAAHRNIEADDRDEIAALRAENERLKGERDALQWVADLYDGEPTPNSIAAEMADYKMLLEEVPLVYDHVSGGRISKPLTKAFEVIREHDQRRTDDVDEAVIEAI